MEILLNWKLVIKACFDMILRKYFATNFTFNKSVGMKGAW